jgi:hypothetical protein
MLRFRFATLVLVLLPLALQAVDSEAGRPWPADVPGFVPPAAGEHPRLLFRKSDLVMLRQRAATREGQAIIKRLRATLDGANGDTFPKLLNGSGHAYQGNKPTDEAGADKDNGAKNSNHDVGKGEDMPLGTFTFSHAAGYGLLYQLTGEKTYADLGRQAMQKALDGVRDRDDRYAFRKPGGALRTGPSLGWTALGYDLCYDGWDPAFREQVATEFSKYDEGPNMSIESCILGKRQHPGSNHWGMEVGGSAMAMLAILNDPGTDMAKFGPLVVQSQKIMVRNMTEGFGDGGFFAEGDGTGSMSSHIVFLSALQAWKVAAGKDFITPRPNAQWMANRWFLQTLAKDGKADFQPQRGGYPHNIWNRTGLSGSGYFSIGMGVAVSDDVKAAQLWFYNHGGFAAADERSGTPCDTPSPYPHHSVLAFVNWPIGIAERNPDGIIPHAVCDSKWGFYAWRNRWQDADDVVITILTRFAKGNYSCKAESTLSIDDGGKKLAWGNLAGGFTGDFKPAANGSTVLTTANGGCLAVDFSGASGVTALLVASGAAAPAGGDTLDVGGKKVALLFLGTGTRAKPMLDGNRITVGDQVITVEDGRLALARQ